MPREFKFRKDDGRKKKRRDFGNFWVEETRVEEVSHKEIREGDPEHAEIEEIAQQVGDELSDGRITPAEAKRRLTSAVHRLSTRGNDVCPMCGTRNRSSGSFVCASCGAEVEFETEIELDFEGFDDE
ncbi:MAG: hypothetical protein GTO46_07695 [Gemmatimonadetes bacterium]|nr:hypothetical protein [Gemmatimonadota bacterium]NIO31514.1 hypothetical protein [Gemmatimonadota bacterium]